MSTVLARSLALAFGGLIAGLGLVLALFGGGVRERWAQSGDAAAPRPLASAPSTATAPAPSAEKPGPAAPGESKAQISPPGPAPSLPGSDKAGGRAEKTETAAPSFDVVRVEPNGDSVVAGRAKPGSTVEMLVDGKPVARAQADGEGQFAIVPPPLSSGGSEIVLRATGADGRTVRSKESVAVAVPPTRDGKPLVALTAPDAPTTILSQPGPAAKPESKGAAAQGPAKPPRIVSVDTQDGGRLYVSCEAAPGAAVRLYLNDTLIAPGQAGADGKVSFTIGKGVRPGAYRIRIDQVDPETGKVRVRAEVPFTVPDTAARVAARSAPEPDSRAVSKPDAGKDVSRDTGKVEDTPAEAGRGAAGPGQTGHSGTGHSEAAGAGSAAGSGVQAPGQDKPQRSRTAASGESTAPPQAQPGQGVRAPAPPTEDATAAGSRSRDGHSTRPARTADAGSGTRPPRPAGDVFVPEISTARIERGNSLWQISRRTYGRGNRYTVIYDANQDQIRDPDLIYPGQIFVLPDDKTCPCPAPGARRRG